MKERGILFSGPMVRAILSGSKSQTRRVVTPQPTHPHIVACPNGAEWGEPDAFLWDAQWEDEQGRHGEFVDSVRCPFGGPGDRLYVRETFSRCACTNCLTAWPGKPGPDRIGQVHYPAYQATHQGPSGYVWKPSIHMPRWASRITLEITDVRVERVAAITEEDAKAEGMAPRLPPACIQFACLWDQLNWERGYGWNENPWVFVIAFKRVDG